MEDLILLSLLKGADLMKTKSCEACIHFWSETYGDGFHEPRETEYGCNMSDEDVIEKYYDEKETTCPYFDGGICEVCGAFIGKRFVYWASGPYSEFKCCSQECQKNMR
jgi:hypothetical protein